MTTNKSSLEELQAEQTELLKKQLNSTGNPINFLDKKLIDIREAIKEAEKEILENKE